MSKDIEPLTLVERSSRQTSGKAETVKISGEAYIEVLNVAKKAEFSIQKAVSIMVLYAAKNLNWIKEGETD